MTSRTTTLERPGADASVPDTQIHGALGAGRASAEGPQRPIRRLVAGLWQAVRQAPAFY